MRCRNLLTWVAFAVAAVTLSCGGEGPSSPSGTGVEVRGVVLGEGSAFVASSGGHPSAAKAQKVTVTVEGTPITAEVGADGTFVLRGIPSGSFTLVFTVDGTTIGEVPVSAADGAEVTVTVKVSGGKLVLVEMKVKNPGPVGTTSACLINGGKEGAGIELEGTVQSGDADQFDMTVNGQRSGVAARVSATTATTYRCIGGAKTDTLEQCKALIERGGAKVHVRGTLDDCDANPAPVTATEVKIQKD